MISINNTGINLSSTGARKVLLVIDWSNIMFRTLFMHKLFTPGPDTYERIEDLQSFTNKFAMDICSIVNMFKPNKVILATDSQHAWRKNILPGDDGYKSGRKKDPSINWDNIYRCSDDLLGILSRHGFDVANTEHAEADDIICMVKELVQTSHNEYNIIVVSADADIRQLIYFNADTKQYCVVYNTTSRGKNTKRRMYVTQSFMDWLNTPETGDIFFTEFDANKHYIRDLFSMNSIIETFVDDPDDVVLSKILCGDASDNVPAFYGFYKDGKYNRVTPTKAKKILEMTGATNVASLQKSLPRFPEIFERICKKKIDDINFSERMERQRMLVELNSDLFPESIRQYKETLDYILNSGNGNVIQNIRSQEVLKGTAYEGANKRKAIEADVFKDFRKMAANRKKGAMTDMPSTAVINELFDTNALI